MADKPTTSSLLRPSGAFEVSHGPSRQADMTLPISSPIASRSYNSSSSPAPSSSSAPPYARLSSNNMSSSVPSSVPSRQQTASSPPSNSNSTITHARPAMGVSSHYSANSADMTKKMDITSLMSPPDPVLDSFHQDGQRRSIATTRSVGTAGGATASRATAANATAAETQHDEAGRGVPAKHPLPMSPPVSPHSKSVSHPAERPSTPPPSSSSAQTVSDPVLYPQDDSVTAPSPPQPPLFAPSELEHHRRIVDDHLRARSSGEFGHFEPPTREQYHLILTFRSQVMKHYKANPRGWLRKERALLEADRRAGAHRYHAIMPAKPKPLMAAKPSRAQRADRVAKPSHGPSAGTQSSAAGAGPSRPIRTGGGSGTNPTKRSASRTSPTPEPSRRAVAPNREDKDFNALPDYCPPLSSLPSRPNSLKVEWKGQPIDLSADPHAHLLHPDEVALAGNLRLDCATYLTSKRRVFERRLQCLRTGKEFRKTDAQQACKIDVNKASKLWTAFDRVGWLDAHWVRRFL